MAAAHVNNEQTCDNCQKTTAGLRRLPCNHVICLYCVQRKVKDASRTNNLSCPRCEMVFTIPIVPKDNSEQPVYHKEKYKEKIEKTPETKHLWHEGKIMGMTILHDELFVVCKHRPTVIYKYDISDLGSKNPVRIDAKDIVWPRGMAANESLKSLYITDWSKVFGGNLWRYKFDQNEQLLANKTFTNESQIDIQPFGISVTPERNLVLVTCATPANFLVKKGYILVFQDVEDKLQLLKTVELPGVEIPRHSVMTSSSVYLVCHGWNLANHGVSCFKENEKQVISRKSFYGSTFGGGSGEQGMNRPLSLTLDEDGLVLVVDYYNHRIQLLTENLLLVRHLITKGEHAIEYPRHACQHVKSGRLFVGQENGSVHIFDVRFQPK